MDPDLDEPADMSTLEVMFNHAEHSGAVIRFVRHLASKELRDNQPFYAPFVNGCGRWGRWECWGWCLDGVGCQESVWLVMWQA